ncbi:hypothetical protein J2W71_004188 [Pseudomonas sp. 3400]|nr:hypothetical protein [Pseudomonas sp. 3400]MDR7014417.1 hypothetical protein [Pseudomonas alcaliphila]
MQDLHHPLDVIRPSLPWRAGHRRAPIGLPKELVQAC